VVNIPFIWITLPAAALLCRRNPAIGLAGAGFLLTNGLAHTLGAVKIGYSSGTVTSALIFLPLSIWVFHTFYAPGKLLSRPLLAANLVAAILAQAILLVLLKALMGQHIPIETAAVIQIIDPALLLLVPFVASRIWRPSATVHDPSRPG
jgi:hypothetical protein